MEKIELPGPQKEGEMSVEEAIGRRRSNRSFASKSLSLPQVGQLLWAVHGLSGSGGRKRCAPSAGATYPLVVHIAVRDRGVGGLETGVYRYDSEDHSLTCEIAGDIQEELAGAAYDQDFIAAAPANILIEADFSRTTDRYGERGIRFVYMEVGHAGENLYLQAVAMGLSTVAVGAFKDKDVSAILDVDGREKPLYIMPVGYPQDV